jgi:hypothetical protein
MVHLGKQNLVAETFFDQSHIFKKQTFTANQMFVLCM